MDLGPYMSWWRVDASGGAPSGATRPFFSLGRTLAPKCDPDIRLAAGVNPLKTDVESAG